MTTDQQEARQTVTQLRCARAAYTWAIVTPSCSASGGVAATLDEAIHLACRWAWARGLSSIRAAVELVGPSCGGALRWRGCLPVADPPTDRQTEGLARLVEAAPAPGGRIEP